FLLPRGHVMERDFILAEGIALAGQLPDREVADETPASAKGQPDGTGRQQLAVRRKGLTDKQVGVPAHGSPPGPLGDVPQGEEAAVTTARRGLAIRGELHGQDLALLAVGYDPSFPAYRIPKTQRSVLTAEG